MALKIILSNMVSFKVEGSINNEEGVAEPFDFVLKCERLDDLQVKVKLDSGIKVQAFLLDVVRNWSGPRDADDKPVPFSEDAFKGVCNITGMAILMYQTYLQSIGAKQKN